MEVKNYNDFLTNAETVKSMLKELIDWINSHENPNDRASLLALVLSTLSKELNLSPALLTGVLETEKVTNIYMSLELSKQMNPIQGVDFANTVLSDFRKKHRK